MATITKWSDRYDVVKLLYFTLALIPMMMLGIKVSDGLELFSLLALVGVVLCGVVAYWLGNWKWLFIPLLTMAVEIACAIPVALQDPHPLETPISIIAEAPFWTGLPALLGASVGYVLRRVSE